MALWVGIFTALLFFAVGKNWLMDLSNPLKYGFFFIWLFIVMLWLSFGVVRHAEWLGYLVALLEIVGVTLERYDYHKKMAVFPARNCLSIPFLHSPSVFQYTK
jgi:hypothetical protein